MGRTDTKAIKNQCCARNEFFLPVAKTFTLKKLIHHLLCLFVRLSVGQSPVKMNILHRTRIAVRVQAFPRVATGAPPLD